MASFSVWGRLLPYLKGPGIILVFAPVDRMVRISGATKNTALVFPMPVDISHITKLGGKE